MSVQPAPPSPDWTRANRRSPPFYDWGLLLLSLAGWAFSLWILLPPLTFALLPLAVAAPEISPGLAIWNAIAALLSVRGVRKFWICRVAFGLSLVGLLVSLLPLSQFPIVSQQAESAMVQALGERYQDRVPPVLQSRMRTQPLVLTDLLRGIAVSPVRYTPDIPFAAADGVPLTLDVYRPVATGRYPAIAVIYGGGWQSGKPTDHAQFSRYLAAQGYVVWAVSYRHAPRYAFPAQLQDIQTAIAFIQQHAAEYDTDPTRLALLGRSAGAHLAMLAAYTPGAPPIRAVVNYYGPVDLLEGYFDLPDPDPLDVRAVLRAFLGGTPEQVGDRYRIASPITYVRRSLPPTLLVYGGRDHIVLPKFGRRLFHRLQSTQNRAVLLEIPWAEHAFDAVFPGLSSQLSLYYTERFLAWALHE